MKTLVYTIQHRLNKLHDELIAAIPALAPVGVPPNRDAVFSISGDGILLTLIVPDAISEPQIQAVLAAHDPTTPSAAEIATATANANEQTLRDRADQAVATLESAYANWTTLTAVQKDQALRLQMRATSTLLRLQLRKLGTIPDPPAPLLPGKSQAHPTAPSN